MSKGTELKLGRGQSSGGANVETVLTTGIGGGDSGMRAGCRRHWDRSQGYIRVGN